MPEPTNAAATPQATTPASPAPASTDPVSIGKRHGKDIRVAPDRVNDLALKGLDYETRIAAVKAAEAEHVNNPDWQAFKQFQQSFADDPLAKRAVAAALKNPDAVLNGLKNGKPTPAPPAKPVTNGHDAGDDDTDDDEPEVDATPRAARNGHAKQPDPEVQSLRQRLDDRDRIDNAKQMKGLIEAELRQYPWLLNPGGALSKQGSLAYRTAVAALSQPGTAVSISGAVADAANEILEAREEEAAGKIAAADAAKARYRGSDIRNAPAAGTPPPKLDRNSFKDGTITRLALAEAQRRGLG